MVTAKDFIRLTKVKDNKGDTLFVPRDNILAFFNDKGGSTVITNTGGFFVQETPEEIYRKLETAVGPSR